MFHPLHADEQVAVGAGDPADAQAAAGHGSLGHHVERQTAFVEISDLRHLLAGIGAEQAIDLVAEQPQPVPAAEIDQPVQHRMLDDPRRSGCAGS